MRFFIGSRLLSIEIRFTKVSTAFWVVNHSRLTFPKITDLVKKEPASVSLWIPPTQICRSQEQQRKRLLTRDLSGKFWTSWNGIRKVRESESPVPLKPHETSHMETEPKHERSRCCFLSLSSPCRSWLSLLNQTNYCSFLLFVEQVESSVSLLEENICRQFSSRFSRQ